MSTADTSTHRVAAAVTGTGTLPPKNTSPDTMVSVSSVQKIGACEFSALATPLQESM